MRDIVFRGKRVDNGNWVEGSLVRKSGNVVVIIPIGMPITAQCVVDPETVGQFTGLLDKNGKRIFEGDIVSFTRVNALGYTTSRVGDVRYYDKLPIFYIMATTGDAWDWCYCENIEVIGTIYDDPELLEGETK